MPTVGIISSNSLKRGALLAQKKLFATQASEIVASKVKTCGILSINRPKAFNAFNLPMIKTMDRVFLAFDGDSKVILVFFI